MSVVVGTVDSSVSPTEMTYHFSVEKKLFEDDEAHLPQNHMLISDSDKSTDLIHCYITSKQCQDNRMSWHCVQVGIVYRVMHGRDIPSSFH